MDGHRFDEVARSLSCSQASRRSLIMALATSAVGTTGGLVRASPAGAAKRCKKARSGHRGKCKQHKGKRCRPAEPSHLATCDRDAQCCRGLVCEERACKAGCRLDGAFHAPGAANPANRCQSCQPATSTTAWTNNACGDCQLCDPGTGACTNDPAKLFTACGNPDVNGFRPGFCVGDTCQPPCGEDCVGYCYLQEDSRGQPNPTNPFCCPINARGPDGACCWINGAPGIFVEGGCTAPLQVCADGTACPTECCGGSSSGFAGICPSATQFCVAGTIRDAGFACTTDQDCATAGYGGGSRCAGLRYDRDQNGQLITVPNSGLCCPGDNVSGREVDTNGGEVFSCCTPGTRYSDQANGCCPASQANCPSCVCSFRNISRCCR